MGFTSVAKSYVKRSVSSAGKNSTNLIRLGILGTLGLAVVMTYEAAPVSPGQSEADIVMAFVAQETTTGSTKSGTGYDVIAGATTDGTIFTNSGHIIIGDLANPVFEVSETGAVLTGTWEGALMAGYLNTASADNRYCGLAGCTMTGNIVLQGAKLIATGATITGNIAASGTLSVQGASSLQGAVTLGSTLNTTGNIAGSGSLSIDGNASFQATMSGDVIKAMSGILAYGGNVNVTVDCFDVELFASGSTINTVTGSTVITPINFPYDAEITKVTALNGYISANLTTIVINFGGTTIFDSADLRIDANELEDDGGATNYALHATNKIVSAGDNLTFDTTIPASQTGGLTIGICYKKRSTP